MIILGLIPGEKDYIFATNGVITLSVRGLDVPLKDLISAY
jgi:hypothetical protein